MTEYWVSKKQYWCQYCSIFIRDDAPSRKQHETGLKHQGNKERFIRDLYKTGTQAKAEKARAEVEMARINAAAEAAYAKDVHQPSSRPMLSRMHPSAGASTSKPRESSKPTDKWANYTSAKDMGFDDEETKKSSFDIEQELKGRAANEPGAWQTVEEPIPQEVYYEEDVETGKRKLGEYGANDDEEEGEGFKFAHRDKRPVRDPYADDDWDPKKALGGIKFKSKVKKENGDVAPVKKEEVGGLDREKWTGKLELGTGSGHGDQVKADAPAMTKLEEGEEKKPNVVEESNGQLLEPTTLEDGGPVEDVKPKVEALESAEPAPESGSTSAASTAAGMFKKRRPKPNTASSRQK